jgi:carboxypeptidase C (cathepsin A)
MSSRLYILIPLLLSCFAIQAQEETKLPIPEIQSFVTKHSGTFAGKKISYIATVGNIQLKNSDGKVYADAVTTSYVATKAKKNRPVTFVFNGGPGSSSVWLHMGVMGPKRVVVPSNAKDAGNAPYSIVDNDFSPIDQTDLVFIDPIGTGFSVLAGEGTAADVWGLKEDAKSVTHIMNDWIKKNNRWNSPKYIAGESFGTTRAAGMMPYLENLTSPMRVNGLLLISQALDYTGSTPSENNFIAYVTYLPTMAATAWYHGKVNKTGKTLESFMSEVREFATDQYLPALFKGSSLNDKEFETIATKYAGLTGLDVEYVKRSNLRVLAGRFLNELLRDEGLSVGRLDGRYTSKELDQLALDPRYDAGSAAIKGAYSMALNNYLVNDLKVTWDRDYHISGAKVWEGWEYDRDLSNGGEPARVNTAPQLALAMTKNPALKVWVANGYYDYATPFFDAEFTFNRHGIDMSRVTMDYYEAGHMMYVHQPSLVKIAEDMRNFYQDN